MLHFDSSQPIVTRGCRFSPAPQHLTLSTFLNFNDFIEIRIFLNGKGMAN